MIWGYPYFWKHPYCFFGLFLIQGQITCNPVVGKNATNASVPRNLEATGDLVSACPGRHNAVVTSIRCLSTTAAWGYDQAGVIAVWVGFVVGDIARNCCSPKWTISILNMTWPNMLLLYPNLEPWLAIFYKYLVKLLRPHTTDFPQMVVV